MSLTRHLLFYRQEPTEPYQVLTDPEKYLRPMVRQRGQPQPRPPR